MPATPPPPLSVAITEGLSLSEAMAASEATQESVSPMTPSADQIQDWDHQFILQTYKRMPVVLARGEGALLWDVDGKRYIDLESGGRAGNALGHAHPKITEALVQQAHQLLYLSNDFYNTNAARLAKVLAQTTNCKRIFFQNSGAEANECALKLARKWAKREHGPDRFEILTAQNSFHGRTFGTLTATGQPKYQEGYEPLPGGFRYVPFNDVAALESAIGPQTAALMFEPILGESGCYPASPEFLQAARRLCDERGMLLILDEIQTGFGRTGKFWAYEHYGIQPDIVTLAKSMGGGLPIGACFATESVATAFQPGDHGCTFGGNPACAATALAAFDALSEDRLIEAAARKGELLRSLLEGLNERQGCFSDLRGKGLMIGVDLKVPNAAEVTLAALELGVTVHAAGTSTLRLLPAYVISEEQLEEAVSILEKAILSVAA